MRSRHYDTRWGVRQTSGISFFWILDDRVVGCGWGGGQRHETRMQSVNGDIGDLCGRPRRRSRSGKSFLNWYVRHL
jgi:hypothetical protein